MDRSENALTVLLIVAGANTPWRHLHMCHCRLSGWARSHAGGFCAGCLRWASSMNPCLELAVQVTERSIERKRDAEMIELAWLSVFPTTASKSSPPSVPSGSLSWGERITDTQQQMMMCIILFKKIIEAIKLEHDSQWFSHIRENMRSWTEISVND